MTVAPPLCCDNQQTHPAIAKCPLPPQEKAKSPALEYQCHGWGTWQQLHILPPSIYRLCCKRRGWEEFLLSPGRKYPSTSQALSPPLWAGEGSGIRSLKVLCLRTRLHDGHPQDVKAALEGATRGLARVQDLLLAKNTASSDHFSWSKTAVLLSWGNKNKCWFL